MHLDLVHWTLTLIKAEKFIQLTLHRLNSSNLRGCKIMMRIVVTFAGIVILSCLYIVRTLPIAANFQNHAANEIPQSCTVTKPPKPPFVPPAPYPSDGQVWIGSPKLWTDIPKDGVWRGLPHYTSDDTRFRQKVFFWSEGYDWRNENPPELTITGTRLDGTAPPLSSDDHANAGWTNDSKHPFIVDGVFIPTAGCWKITGRYKGQELSYVVGVAN